METNKFESTAIVQTLSPLHIGTGDKLTPLSYIYRGDSVLVLDEVTLLNWAGSSPGISSRFITAAEQGGSISSLLSELRVPAEPFKLYELRAEITRTPTEILPFIKTYDQFPYLPGSSLKGSLRSALLRGAILAEPELADAFSSIVIEAAEEGRRRRTGSEAIEAALFVRRDLKDRKKFSNYDLNRALIVSDSRPVKTDKLEIVEVRMLSLQYDGRLDFKKRNNAYVTIFAETAQPKTTFRLKLQRDLSLLAGMGAAEELQLNNPARSRLMLYLTQYCRAAGFELIDQEIDFYQRNGRSDLAGWFEEKRDGLQKKEDLFILPMGWGSGYDAKTVTDLLDEYAFQAVVENFRNTDGLGRPGNNPDNPWLGPDDSPKSRKVVVRKDGTLEPVGWVVVKLEAQGEAPAILSELLGQVEPPDLVEWETPQVTEREAAQEITPSGDRMENAANKEPAANEKPAADEASKVVPEETESIEAEGLPASPNVIGSDGYVLLFYETPEPGERFRGTVIYTDGGKVFLELPGLSADDTAMAWLGLKELAGGEPEEDSLIACRVVESMPDPDQKGLLLVYCTVEKELP